MASTLVFISTALGLLVGGVAASLTMADAPSMRAHIRP